MPPEIFLAGTTAVGKTEIALLLAERIGAEIISVDSMQVYRGLDIGTAKPSGSERARIPHHLVDVVEPTDTFDAATFIRLAKTAVAAIHSRKRIALFCGGTGLYFRAYLRGLGDSPAASEELRDELTNSPLSELLREIETKDPELYKTIDRSNPRRLIRAVEVIRLTGKPYSAQRAFWKADDLPPFFVLDRKREDLHRRIDARVEQMFRRGLVEEVQKLKPHLNKTALQAIGYKQVVEHLEGVRPLVDTIELVKIRTRQYAKRQLTWFRRETGAEWLTIGENETAQSVARRIEEKLAWGMLATAGTVSQKNI